MVVHLLNSAMCPQEGTYRVSKITPEQARQIVQKAEVVKSYIGYPQTAEYMSSVLGIQVEVNRGETRFEDGDIAVVCKLKYRVANPADKGSTVDPDAFEWYVMFYESNRPEVIA